MPESSGGSIPGSGEPAFRLWAPHSSAIPVLIAVPHAGRDYDQALTGAMRDPAYAMARLEDRMVDDVARIAAQETGAPLLVAQAPRALIDLNRAPEDIDWEMVSGAPQPLRRGHGSRRSRSGLGLVPRRLAGLGEIWNGKLAYADLQARIESVHRPYHRTLGLTLESIRDQWGSVLLLDLHSMPPLKRRYPDEAVPEFVVGDRFGASCHHGLSAGAAAYLHRQGRVCATNRPYAGGYVLERHAQPARGIHCLQIEICRSSYLDAQLQQPSARLPQIGRLLAGLARELAATLGRIGGNAATPLAAE